MKRFLLPLFFGVLILGSVAAVQAQDGDSPTLITPENAAEITLLAELPTSGQLLWSPDGTTLVVHDSADLFLYDLLDLAAAPAVIADDFWRVAYQPDGTLIGLQRRPAEASEDATVGMNNDLNVVQVQSGQYRTTLFIETRFISSLTFSQDAALLAVGTEENSIQVWDLVSGELLGTLIGHEVPPSTLAFSADNRFLVSTGGRGDNLLFLWDIDSWSPLRVLSDVPDEDILAEVGAFSPDGAWLVTGAGRGVPLLRWNAAAISGTSVGAEHTELIGGLVDVVAVAFHPDSQILAAILTYPIDMTVDFVRLLDVVTGVTLAEWTVPAGANGVSFSADGAYLAVAQGEQSTTQLWGIKSGGAD